MLNPFIPTISPLLPRTSTWRHRTTTSLLLLCVIAFVTGCSRPKDETEQLARAQQFLSNGNLTAALIDAKNVLALDGSSIEARRVLAHAELGRGNPAAAEIEFQRLLAQAPDEPEFRTSLAKSLLEQGKADEVLAIDLQGLEGAHKADLLVSHGLALLGTENYDAARKAITQALSLSPDSSQVLIANARLQFLDQKNNKALATLDRVFQLDETNPVAWELVGDIHWSLSELPESEAAFTKALKSPRFNYQGLYKRAIVNLRQDRPDAAETDIEALVAVAPTNSDSRYLQGLLFLHRGDLIEAQSALEAAVAGEDINVDALYQLALTHYQLGNLGQAEQYGKQFLLINTDSRRARLLLARIRIRNERYASAEELLRPLRQTNNTDAETAQLLINVLFRQNKPDDAISLLADPALALITANESLDDPELNDSVDGEISGARTLNESVLVTSPLSKEHQRILVIYEYLRADKVDLALQEVRELESQMPDELATHTVRGHVYLAAGRREEAKIAFERALQRSPGSPVASHALADLALENQELKTARTLLETTLNAHSDHLPSMLKLARLDALEQGYPAMLKRLKRAQEVHPYSMQASVLLARFYLLDRKPLESQMQLQRLSVEQREHTSVLSLMAMAQLQNAEYEAALHTLMRLSKIQADEASWHYMMASAYRALGDTTLSDEALALATELEPDFLPARLVSAKRALDDQRNADFQAHFSVLDNLAPQDEDIQRLRSIAIKQGALPSAEPLSPRASNIASSTSGIDTRQPNSESVDSTRATLEAAAKLWDEDDLAGSIALLRDSLNDVQSNVTIRTALANALESSGQYEAALMEYRTVIEADPRNLVALNNAAWHLRKDNPTVALRFAERAADIAPDAPAVLDTLASVQLSSGDVSSARETLKRVVALDSTNPVYQYHLAQAELSSGNRNAALSSLAKALDSAEPFIEREAARRLALELETSEQ